jgi:hypothetical protein
MKRAIIKPWRWENCIIFFVIAIFCFLGFFAGAFAEINYYDGNKHMIAGMPYWVEKAGEGKWWCHYGDKKVLWEPKAWQQADYKEQGPAYYNKFMQGGIQYPYDLPMEAREKLTPNEIKTRCIDLRSYAYCKDWKGEFGIHIVDSKGGVRDRMVLEWGRNYRQHQDKVPPEWKGHYYYKFFIVFTYPEDSKGLGETAIVKSSIDSPDDVYLYLPSQRKVRRLSVGSKKDSFAGTPDKNEDVFNYHALHPCKFIRNDIFECPGKEVWGYGDSEIEHDPTALHMDGIGGPCWVVEETPAWPNWWFAKKIIWFDKRTFATQFEQAYDAKGRLIRTANFNQRVVNPTKFPTYTLWADWGSHDLLNNVKHTYFRANDPTKNSFYDTNFSESVFSQQTLTEELTSLTKY